MARAFLLRDANGQTILFISCDLFALPDGLRSKVAKLLADRGLALPPENIVINATHTHQSQANYLSSSIYNRFASNTGGFDRSMLEFLAGQLANAALAARADLNASESLPHRLVLRKGRVCGLTRNRALDAFQHDPIDDQQEVFNLSSQCELPGSGIRYQAVDPTLRIVDIQRQSGNVWLNAATMIFVAVHPTAMSHDTPVNSPDFTGYAMSVIEKETAEKTSTYTAGFFNGAEGDVSPNWDFQNRRDLIRLARMLADAVLTSRATLVDDKPVFVAKRRDERWKDLKRIGIENPKFGMAALGGAEDGRSWLYNAGCNSGAGVDCAPSLGPASLGISLSRWAKWAQTFENFPERIPVSVIQFGSLLDVVAIPFEMTTVAGLRLAKDVSALDSSRDVAIVCLANEYLSSLLSG